MNKNKTVHFIASKKPSEYFNSKVWVITACRLGHYAEEDIKGTRNKKEVTCKNCLRHLKARGRQNEK